MLLNVAFGCVGLAWGEEAEGEILTATLRCLMISLSTVEIVAVFVQHLCCFKGYLLSVCVLWNLKSNETLNSFENCEHK